MVLAERMKAPRPQCPMPSPLSRLDVRHSIGALALFPPAVLYPTLGPLMEGACTGSILPEADRRRASIIGNASNLIGLTLETNTSKAQ